jgi:hypothetical protein
MEGGGAMRAKLILLACALALLAGWLPCPIHTY